MKLFWFYSVYVFAFFYSIQTNEPKQGQGRGKKGHDAEVEHEEDDAKTSEQPNEKQSEECSGEWDMHVPEQAVIVSKRQIHVVRFLHCCSPMDYSF